LGNAVNDLMALTSFMLKMKILKIHNSLHWVVYIYQRGTQDTCTG
jgi:hypothetical protein